MATAFAYGNGVIKTVTGSIDLDTDTFKAMLTGAGYVPDPDNHIFRSSITNEISGTGYTTGGTALTGVTCTYDPGTNEVRWDFNDPTWPGATFSARYMVVYKSRGGAASADELIMYVDFGADQQVAAGTFTYIVPPTGALAYVS